MILRGIEHFVQSLNYVLIATVLILSGGATSAAPAGSPWGADYFPNVELLTQEGKTVRFYDDLIKDKVVIIDFIFTQCQGVCPVETANLRQVQKRLGDRVGRDIFMYSISLDPEHDTPAMLMAHAKKFNVAPGWLFLTGKAEDIKLLRQKLGLYRTEDEKSLGDHKASLMVGNEATGQWIKRSAFDSPEVLAGVVGGELHNWKVRDPGLADIRRSYAEAPRLPKLSHGEELFHNRCMACHSIGGGDGLGPDLVSITHKREPGWLSRWLKAPDRMLAEKDPLAMKLFLQYQQRPMPNLQLSDADVAALIDYLEHQHPQEMQVSTVK